jgi:RimJ/RimL family protein N-acetyltransferase
MTDLEEALPVLPRELTSITPAVRSVGAPPIPVIAEPYAMRLADPDADADMVSEWMNRPHLAQAWEYDWPPHRWRGHLRAQLAGEYSRPIIASVDGVDIGYVELYRAAKDSIATRYAAEPHDIGLHAAIADNALVNRGVAALLFPSVVAELFGFESQCRRIMFDPDHRNAGARRVCEQAGCEFLGEHDMTNRRMSLYAFHRPPSP